MKTATQTDSLSTRRVRRMNCSRICFRRRLGRLSLGMTNLSRWGTLSPTSCISPSTAHHSVFSSPGFLFHLDAAAATRAAERKWPRRTGSLRRSPGDLPAVVSIASGSVGRVFAGGWKWASSTSLTLSQKEWAQNEAHFHSKKRSPLAEMGKPTVVGASFGYKLGK